MEYVMYIIVNMDQGMDKNQVVMQVGHLVGKLTERMIQILYQLGENHQVSINYLKWKQSGCKKVVLKGSTSLLEQLRQDHQAEQMVDSNQTPMVVGFLPSNRISARFSNLKLL